MERSRIIPRLRPRPYDLRRKVLLKNFLREQMTYIPPIRSTAETALEVNNNSDFDENESNSVTNSNEGNILTPKKVQDNIVTPVTILEPTPSTSNCSEKENSNNRESSSVEETTTNKSEVEERSSSKFSRLSRFIETIDSRLSSRKSRRKGITKAKHELSSNKGILKHAGRKIIKDSESSSKVKAKSFFERFKSRREKKRNKFATSKISNLFGSRNPSPSKCDSKVATTSTQSVQTDMSWSPDHYERMEESHRSLLEENRLLSESLSSIISYTDTRTSSTQNSCITDSYTESSSNSASHINHERKPVVKTVSNISHSPSADCSRTRILRSKSMQSRSIQRNIASSRLRTRSMNYRDKKPYDPRPFVTNKPRYCEQIKVHPSSSHIPSFVANKPHYCEQGQVNPRAKTRPSVLQSIGASTLFHTDTSLLLQTLSSKSGKAIIRRSSMPERTYHWNNKPRPVRSSSMRENNLNRYSYTSERVSPLPPPPPPPRRRSTTFNGYSSSVPFQDLPAEAFY